MSIQSNVLKRKELSVQNNYVEAELKEFKNLCDDLRIELSYDNRNILLKGDEIFVKLRNHLIVLLTRRSGIYLSQNLQSDVNVDLVKTYQMMYVIKTILQSVAISSIEEIISNGDYSSE